MAQCLLMSARELEPGLRARKKRQTRLAISQVATKLFIERGFDRVTVAEIADSAGVSVNTIFNYFKTKEDLFFDRAEEVEEAASAVVRARLPGESAVDSLARVVGEAIARGTGVFAARNLKPFLATVEKSPALKARARLLFERAQERLAATLADDVGARADDPEPRLVAAQVMGVLGLVTGEFQHRVLRGESATKYRRELARLCERGFQSLRDGVGAYARRARSSSTSTAAHTGGR
jgi:AcrR family transcriptional regulator